MPQPPCDRSGRSGAASARGLDALVGSLNANGALDATRHRTIDRLAGLGWLRDQPEIGDGVIRAPVFRTGLPRCGGTYSQYLFDVDRR